MHRKLIHPMMNNVRTFYEFPLLDKITARYTLEWNNQGAVQRMKVHNRFTDFEGYFPSINSILALPNIIKTYSQHKKSPILGVPVPFLVVDAIRFLDSIVQPGMQVLELGGGNSTLWFLKKGADVITVEHSAEWADYILKFIDSNAEISRKGHLQMEIKSGGNTISFIENQPDKAFDIILIDCANEHTRRNECVRAARNKVKKGGWMIIDNSDHPQNWLGVDLMKDFDRIRYTGYAPMCLVVCQTSFWKI